MKKRERERKGQEYCKWIDQLVSIPHSTTHYMIMHRHPYAHSPHPHMHTNDLFVVFFVITFGVHLLVLSPPLESPFGVHIWSPSFESTFGVHLLDSAVHRWSSPTLHSVAVVRGPDKAVSLQAFHTECYLCLLIGWSCLGDWQPPEPSVENYWLLTEMYLVKECKETVQQTFGPLSEVQCRLTRISDVICIRAPTNFKRNYIDANISLLRLNVCT